MLGRVVGIEILGSTIHCRSYDIGIDFPDSFGGAVGGFVGVVAASLSTTWIIVVGIEILGSTTHRLS